MKSVFSLGIFAVLLAVSTAQVEELNDANFRTTVTSKSFVLIEFYSPKCPYCKEFAPEYTAADKQLSDSQSSVLVSKVDCTSDSSKISCSNIKFVPWIVMYHKGKELMEFGNRTRDAASIVQFVSEAVNSKDKAQDSSPPTAKPQKICDQSAGYAVKPPVPEAPSPVSALTDANFDTFVKSYPYVIVDYYTPWCSDCAHLKPMYDEAAKNLSETTPSIKFATVDCNQGNTATFLTCQNSKLKFYPWVVLYHDGRPQSFLNQENVPDTNTIYNFINKDTNIIGGVMQLDDSNFDSTIAGFPVAVVDFYAPWCFYCKKMAPIYEDIAKDEQEAHPNVRLIKVDCSATNAKTKTICARNEIAFLPTVKVFEHGRFVKEYDGDKTKKDQISGFIGDILKDQQQSMRRTLESKKDKAADKKKDSSKKKTSKDKKTKEDDTKDKKKIKNLDAAKILKKVFKQFTKKSHKKKSKHNDDDDDDDDDDDEDDRKKNSWQQVAKDIHHIAKDIHKLSKEFHKANMKKPAVDRMVKAFKKMMSKSKDTEED